MPEEKQIPELQNTSPQSQIPALRDKRVLPEGVVPKQAQGYVIAGLAVLILLAVMFSKNHAKPAPKEAATSPLAVSTDMNQRKIQELEQDLTADQRQTQQAQKISSTNATSAANTPNAVASGAAPATQLPPVTDPPRDPVADAERELAFKSRFVSNLVAAGSGAVNSPVESTDMPATRSSSEPQQASAARAAT